MKIRRIVSLTVFISFIFLAFSGIMLFLSPQGRVAYWAGWTLMGLTKDQHSAVHTTFMVLFLTAGIWHTVLNWRPIVGYLKNRSKQLRVFTPEFTFSLLLCLLFFVGPLAGLPPFQQFLDAGEAIKAYWERTHGSPPWGHAEEATLESFCRRIGNHGRGGATGGVRVDCAEARIALEEAGIRVESMSQQLIDIARANDTNPQAVADVVLSVGEPAVGEQGAGEIRDEGGYGFHQPGSGLGRMTLREYAERYGYDVEELLSILRTKGMNVDPDNRLREEADRWGVDPAGIIEALGEQGSDEGRTRTRGGRGRG
jgi:hypothetical protein